MDRYIITGGIILTFKAEQPVLENHAILVEDDAIKQVAALDEFAGIAGERIDVAGKLIMPGLINAHHHFYSTLVTGLGKAAPSKDFNEVLENLWWRLDKKLLDEENHISALVSCLSAIRKGTTTIIDHHASPFAVHGSLSQIAKAVKLCGLRANLCYEVSDRDGEAICNEGIEENTAWIKACQQENDPQLKGLFGMHAAFTLSDKSLGKIAERVEQLCCGTHIHAAEAESDEKYNIDHFGKRVVQRLNDNNLINGKSILAHGVHLNPKEMMLVAEKGAAVVTNPQSNLNNAVGIADICRMVDMGITVGLGTDAMTVNMLEELRVGIWAQHLKQNDPSQGFMELVNALVVNNPLIAQKYWGKGHGIISEGSPADIIAVDYIPHTPLNAETWLGHLVYGVSQANVSATICAGRMLMWEGELLLDMNEAEMKARSRSLAEGLWKRF